MSLVVSIMSEKNDKCPSSRPGSRLSRSIMQRFRQVALRSSTQASRQAGRQACRQACRLFVERGSRLCGRAHRRLAVVLVVGSTVEHAGVQVGGEASVEDLVYTVKLQEAAETTVANRGEILTTVVSSGSSHPQNYSHGNNESMIS